MQKCGNVGKKGHVAGDIVMNALITNTATRSTGSIRPYQGNRDILPPMGLLFSPTTEHHFRIVEGGDTEGVEHAARFCRLCSGLPRSLSVQSSWLKRFAVEHHGSKSYMSPSFRRKMA